MSSVSGNAPVSVSGDPLCFATPYLGSRLRFYLSFLEPVVGGRTTSQDSPNCVEDSAAKTCFDVLRDAYIPEVKTDTIT